ACGDGKQSNVIRLARLFRRDEIAKAKVWKVLCLLILLTQEVHHRQRLMATVSAEELDVVVRRSSGGIKSNHAVGTEALVGDDLVKHALRVFEDARRLGPHNGVLADSRISSGWHPRFEVLRPVEVVPNRLQREVEQSLVPQEGRLDNFSLVAVGRDLILSRSGKRNVRFVRLAAFMVR